MHAHFSRFSVVKTVALAGILGVLAGCAGGPDSGVAQPPVVPTTVDFTQAAGADFHVIGGQVAPLSCAGPEKASYQWIVQDAAGQPITLSSYTSASTNFTAPVIPAPVTVTLVCRMTLTNTVAATATYEASTAYTVIKSQVRVTIDPITTNSTLYATISGNKTVNPGQRLSLQANGAWYDLKGATTAGPLITYAWSLGSGYPDGTTITPTDSANVDVIIPTNIKKAVYFPVTMVATSDGKKSQQTISVFVNPNGNINLSLTPAVQTVQGGATVTIAGSGGSSGTTLFYQWTIVDGPSVKLGAGNTSSVSFVAPTVTAITSMTLRVAVGYEPITTDAPGVFFMDAVVMVKP